MPKRINEVGNKYGRLTVLKFAGRQGTFATWQCKCECGKITVVNGRNLRKGHSTSCGCYVKEVNGIAFGEAAFNSLYYKYRYDAKKNRDLEWGLTEDEFRNIINQKCFYCGIPPSNHFSHGNNGTYLYNGIDRLDSDEGYILGNVVTCCKTCNYAKQRMTLSEFRDWIIRVYNYQKLDKKVQ